MRQLEASRFDMLHHGVRALGVVCHDRTHACARYLSTADHGNVRLYDAVATSASIPTLFPARPIEYAGQICEFTDGGLSDALPIGFARDRGLSATHLIVSDCRSRGTAEPDRLDLISLHPRLERTTALRSPRSSLLETVAAGEAAVTDQVIARARAWQRAGN